jgi:oxygen-independent coproporphyrinogen-3 oxidase
VEAVVSLRPERIALFGYAHVPWMKAHQRLIEEWALPGAAERLRQFEAAAEHLERRGYVRIGIDHFALPDDTLARALLDGGLRRNFQGYTSDAPIPLIGLGASSISNLPQGYAQNAAQELHWRAALKEGRLPVARGLALTADDRFRGEIIERLMCDLTVDLDEVCARHGRQRSELSRAIDSLAPFVADGLLEVRGGYLAMRGLGHVVVRSVCAAFDAHLAPEAGRHSRAL